MNQIPQWRRLSLMMARGKRLEDSIELMQQAVMLGLRDPKTRELVACVTAGCKARDDTCEVAACFEFLKQNVKYMADPINIDQFQTLERTLQFGIGDCDDQVVAICTLLAEIGYETKFRVIQSQGSDSWNHVFALVILPKRAPTAPVPLDLTLHNAAVGLQPPPAFVTKYRDFPAVL